MREQDKRRWQRLWRSLGAKGSADAVLSDLVARYSESHRAYHTLAHVKHCLAEFDQVRHLIVRPDELELAIWYHDSVYDTRSKDSEERSAELVREMIQKALLPARLGQSVLSLILATKFTATPTDPDARFLADIDLSILGQPQDKFDEYERQIRVEYSWVPEDQFVAGRSAVLKSFLSRPQIYSTQFFRDKYEVRARQNIIRSLAQLSNRS